MKEIRHDVGDYSALDNLKFSLVNKSASIHCDDIVTFDIETSTGYKDGVTYVEYGDWVTKDTERISLMYVWQAAVENGNNIHVFYGRTYDQLVEFTDRLTYDLRFYALTKTTASEQLYDEMPKAKKKIVLHSYIHNLGFEFQHFRNAFNKDFINHVFARNLRKPMYAYINRNKVKLIYHDTFSLTRKSLKNWCDDANTPVKKLEEPADFYLPIRTPETPLSDEMMDYCTNDVVCMVYGMQNYRDKYGSLENIPHTQTGEVRRVCKQKIGLSDPEWEATCREITSSYDKSFVEYLEAAYYGGWTHGNVIYVGRNLHNVNGFDISSSYPSVICRKKFPIGIWTNIMPHELPQFKGTHASIATYTFHNLQSACRNTYLSVSRAKSLVEVPKDEPVDEYLQVDNGRIMYCKECTFILTDLDFDTVSNAYTWDSVEIDKVYVCPYKRLPKVFVETVLHYYGEKTKLKGTSSVTLYKAAKEFINSIYGVAVMKIISDMIKFDGAWNSKAGDLADPSKTDVFFTCYQIGVWVAAWARHNLWDGILALDRHVAYGDTDSLKGVFTDKDLKWFDDMNAQIMAENELAAKELGIDPALFTPWTTEYTDNKGKFHPSKAQPIGVWDHDAFYDEFKTLGAKRYCTRTGTKLHMTVAGLPLDCSDDMNNGIGPVLSVDDFVNGVVWDAAHSHKKMHKYTDNQPEFQIWKDENGDYYTSSDKYGIAISPTSFVMNDTSGDIETLMDTLSGAIGIEREYSDYIEIVDIT